MACDVKERQPLAGEHIQVHGEVSIATLAAGFDAFKMAIRRDIDALEAGGTVRKVIGGARSATDRLIVLADHTVIGRTHLVDIAALDAAEALMTDGDPGHDTLTAPKKAGAEVVAVCPRDRVHDDLRLVNRLIRTVRGPAYRSSQRIGTSSPHDQLARRRF